MDKDLTDDDDNESDIEAGKYLLLNLSSRMESLRDEQKEYINIDFGNELGSVKEGLITWSSINKNIERVYAKNHESKDEHQTKKKKESGIPLGIFAQFSSIREWVGFRMKSFLQTKSRGERRFWTAICRIRFILNENLATVKQLVNSDASPHFFQVLSDEDTCK
ncbi:39794_t:CDS:2 [Gigaspora margarita]|uniref:39794_t:CDS:1 n=1 Tax=Gigaspora margarita TaxID=4874 RepID=A0ABN7VC32_GIGMA|nr:39794_t:CDS:2 [Gigaspora margarita]